MSNGRFVEVIKCSKCNKTFAGCIVEYRDEEWNQDTLKYLKSGCTVSIMSAKDMSLQQCDCEDMK